MKKTIFTFLAIAFSIAVFATDIVVTSYADAGAGTLRDAIISAADGDNITFNLTPGNETVTLLSHLDPILNKSITIDGASAGINTRVTVTVTTPGTSAYRIFYYDATGKTFTLKNIELAGGIVTHGGAINMQHGNLTMDNVIVRDSKSSGGTEGGGGIHIRYATTTLISNSQFLNNEAIWVSGNQGNGGAIAIYSGTATISDCFFDGNTGSNHGGAIYASVNLDISGSTFEANTCYGFGGAIGFHDGLSTVTNCTFSDNNAAGGNGWGGAIVIGDDVDPVGSLKVTIRFTTIAGNTTDLNGGGIYLWKGEADVKNCLLGDNTNNDFFGSSTGSLTDGGYNIVEVQAGTHQFGPTNNILGQQANLFGTAITSQTLAYTGGSTKTMEIEYGSVAIGAGVADAGVTKDQRGTTRADPPTIGAFEYISTTYAWIGATDTDWATATNWDSGSVPAAHDDVVITDVTNKPIIGSGTTDATCHDLWIHANASLTVNGKLTFHHNVDHHGTLTVNGEMEFAPEPPIVPIVTSATGEIWMDRNLGATRVAQSSIDAAAYGDLYQWGRLTDGHQIRISGTTTTQSSGDDPGHGDFILTHQDWINPGNDNLWQGTSGTNNPCPSGFRLPTKIEWEAEILSWDTPDAAGAIAAPIKLPLPGDRDLNSPGTIKGVGQRAHIWSSTVNGAQIMQLNLYSSFSNVADQPRAYGLTVRCIKD